MTFDELKEWGKHNVTSIAADNCLLWMWVVSPELPRCISIGEHWGFKYITVGFVWHKRRANVGNYTMSGCELCLIFRKGNIPSDKIRNPGQKQFIEEKIKLHSQKPDEARIRIEKMYPKSNKIELFARKKSNNWDVMGNEVK